MEEGHQRSLRIDGVGMGQLSRPWIRKFFSLIANLDVFYDYRDDDEPVEPIKPINKAKRRRREGSIALSHGEVFSTRTLSATSCEGLVDKRRRLNSDTENSEGSTMEIEVRPPEPRESLSIPKDFEGIVNVDEDAASVNGTFRQNFAAPNECNLHGSEVQWRTPAYTSMTVPFGPAVSDMVSFDQFQIPSSSQICQICQNGITPASQNVFSSSVASPIAALPFHVPQGQINCNYLFTFNSANDVQQPYVLEAQEVHHNVYDVIPLQHRPPYQSESQRISLPWLCQRADENRVFKPNPLLFNSKDQAYFMVRGQMV
ncbi:hypothetical protein M433DRAFT_137023 [Acidomyces richmondensis BFW]|nr:hypothetical protein M433DRAFT_137023 [Acidomyces richmondensis BFW]